MSEQFDPQVPAQPTAPAPGAPVPPPPGAPVPPPHGGPGFPPPPPPVEEMEEMRRRRRRRRRRRFRIILILLLVIILLLVALLFANGGGFGEGTGGFLPESFTFSAAVNATVGTTKTEEEENTAPTADPYAVTVVEDEIYLSDQKVDAQGLKDGILSIYEDGQSWRLVDDHALKATYDDAKAILTELGVSFVEE